LAWRKVLPQGLMQWPCPPVLWVDGYHLLPSVRGDLLMKMGRFTEAHEEIQRAISMTQNLPRQELLTERLKQIEKAALSA
jgi:predicted RNA polymerase sigma factor